MTRVQRERWGVAEMAGAAVWLVVAVGVVWAAVWFAELGPYASADDDSAGPDVVGVVESTTSTTARPEEELVALESMAVAALEAEWADPATGAPAQVSCFTRRREVPLELSCVADAVHLPRAWDILLTVHDDGSYEVADDPHQFDTGLDQQTLAAIESELASRWSDPELGAYATVRCSGTMTLRHLSCGVSDPQAGGHGPRLAVVVADDGTYTVEVTGIDGAEP